MHKRILLINPRIGSTKSLTPHLGLAVLARQIERTGHSVVTLDYSAEDSTPPLEKRLREYGPVFVGISALTPGVAAVRDIVARVAQWKEDTVIAIGGPHATLYPEDLRAVAHLSYIVQGEAEEKIAEIVESATLQASPQIITCGRPSIHDFPVPAFRSFHNYQNITVYPLLTSKGCPFNCSFCSIRHISSRVWRARSVEDCMAEIREASKYLPRLCHVRAIDDEPAVDRDRFHEFLTRFAQERNGLSLEIVNLRAKDVSEETLDLMKKAGVFEVCFGVEHGHPFVFGEIDKGESLEDIARAAELVKRSGLFLRCCFIVGLPHDSYERMMESIRFAKGIRADFFHWNSFIPLKGTRASEWFSANGRALAAKERFSLPGSGGFFVPEPSVETNEFTREEHKKAYVLAVLETDSYILTPRGLVDIVRVMFKHNVQGAALRSLLRQPKCVYKHALRFHKAGLLSYYMRRYLRDGLASVRAKRTSG
jgi:radical SAM superfamily enzyme YgiQ (UPF0313 family)